MLSPRKVKHRKQMKRARHLRGRETRGVKLQLGTYGLRALESGWITNRQIESARVAITRHAKRGGKVWIRIFPDKPLTSKPAETRMGKGKGAPEKWVAEVRSGRILYEMTGVSREVALGALRGASAKLPVRTEIVERTETIL